MTAERLVTKEIRELAHYYSETLEYSVHTVHTCDGDWLTVEELGATIRAEQAGAVHLYLHDVGHVAVISARDVPLFIDEYRDPAMKIGPGPYQPDED